MEDLRGGTPQNARAGGTARDYAAAPNLNLLIVSGVMTTFSNQTGNTDHRVVAAP